MADKTPKWSINPIALAQLITGESLFAGKDPEQGVDLVRVRALLETAFATKLEGNVKLESIFYSDGKTPARLEKFQQLADSLNEPRELAEILQLKLVRDAMELFGEEKVLLVLPYLVPIKDATFALPGAPIDGGRGIVGQWQPLAAADYVVSDVSYLDPVQGPIADCYLIASMISLAWCRRAQWSAIVKETSQEYSYKFHTGPGVISTVNDVQLRLPKNKKGQIAYAHSSTQAEGWPGMFEKAYVTLAESGPTHEPKPADYKNIEWDDPETACRSLVGGAPRHGKTGVDPFKTVLTRCERGVTKEPTMASTWQADVMKVRAAAWPVTGVRERHAYSVLGVMKGDNGPKYNYVVLRDPHGAVFPAKTHATEGSWKLEPGAGSGVTEIPLNPGQGVFALQYDVFDKCFQSVGWVR